MLEAVLFDWGNTLARWELSDAMLIEGHRAGLAAMGRNDSDQAAFTAAFIATTLPALTERRDDEVDYTGAVADLLDELGFQTSAAAVERFVAAEHHAWRPTHSVVPTALRLLDALHDHGLKTALVANLFDPPTLVRDTLAELGLLERLDVVALSGEVGKRKPHPALFQHALDELGVAPADAVMVGDSLSDDVGGGRAVGMRTIQATWFARDPSARPSPDAVAATPDEVIGIVERMLTQG